MTALPNVTPIRGSIVDRLDPRALGEAIFAAVLEEVPGLAQWPEARLMEVSVHCRRHGDATHATLRDGRLPPHDALQFVRELAVRRARDNVPLALLLHTYRAGYRAVWSAIRHAAEAARADLDAVLSTSGLAVEYFNVISTDATRAYVLEREDIAARTVEVRKALVEGLLTGALRHSDENAPQLAAHGLHRRAPCRVVMMGAAVASGDEGGRPTSREDIEGFERALQHDAGPALVAVVHGRLVGILPAAAPSMSAIEAGLAAWLRDERWRVGMSTTHDHLDATPHAFAEAQTAWRIASRERRFVSMSQASIFDVLTADASSAARRVVPEWGTTLLQDDTSGDLLATLEAYLHDDLHVGRAAEKLGVHPNTVRYRLARIETITHTSTRDFHGLVQIYAAVRLLRPAPEPRI
jgi:hypothetical protein